MSRAAPCSRFAYRSRAPPPDGLSDRPPAGLGRILRPMRRLIWLLPFLALAVIIGTAFGYRFVFAPLLGILIYSWATSSLRSMVSDARAIDALEGDGPQLVDLDEGRTMYWCEECGTEVMLVVRGNGRVPRHCGTGMHERVELVG